MKFKTKLKVAVFAVLVVCAGFSASVVYGQNSSDPYGLDTTAGAAQLTTDKDVPTIIGNVVGAALSLVSVLFFILMIYGGVRWMLARGHEDEARKALDTIIGAIIGILIILGAYAITRFILEAPGAGSSGGGGGTTQEQQVGSCTPDPAVDDDDIGTDLDPKCMALNIGLVVGDEAGNTQKCAAAEINGVKGVCVVDPVAANNGAASCMVADDGGTKYKAACASLSGETACKGHKSGAASICKFEK